MTDLIACLSSGKGTRNHLLKVISGQEWNNIFLITNDFGKQNFKPGKEVNYIIIDENQPVSDIVERIKADLKNEISDTEVALNLASGSGKEHMAILSAVMHSGLGFRLVALTKDGIKEV